MRQKSQPQAGADQIPEAAVTGFDHTPQAEGRYRHEKDLRGVIGHDNPAGGGDGGDMKKQQVIEGKLFGFRDFRSQAIDKDGGESRKTVSQTHGKFRQGQSVVNKRMIQAPWDPCHSSSNPDGGTNPRNRPHRRSGRNGWWRYSTAGTEKIPKW
jgi:hypothetical protein